MSDLRVSTEAEYYRQAELLGAGRAKAEQVLRDVTAGEESQGRQDELHQLAYEQRVADLNRNPK